MLLLAEAVGDFLHYRAAVGGSAHVLRSTMRSGTGARYWQMGTAARGSRTRPTGGVGYQRVKSVVVIRDLQTRQGSDCAGA